MVSIIIDGRKVEAEEGKTILDIATSEGINIPHLCSHDGISPYGACRLCTVEITQNGRTRLQAACSYPVSAGIEIKTDSPRVAKGRQIIFEFLLARCPDVKAIREYARQWGVRKTRFASKIKDDCILCGLCVRACSEVVGAEAIGFSGRGVTREVDDSPFGIHSDRCIGCGLCTYVCPTGKAQMESKTAPILRQAVGTERTCRYMLMGLVSSKTCPENIQCSQCPYDQLMEFAYGKHPALVSPPSRNNIPSKVGPFLIPADRSYTKNHTWVRYKNSSAVVGIDHFLSTLFGPVDDVDVKKGRIQLVSGKRKLALPIGVKGDVEKINSNVITTPRLINFSPYHRGWVAIIKLDKGSDSTTLAGQDATRWLLEDINRLRQFIDLDEEEVVSPPSNSKWHMLKKYFFERDT